MIVNLTVPWWIGVYQEMMPEAQSVEADATLLVGLLPSAEFARLVWTTPCPDLGS
jgi:hypothetical protein